MRKLAAVALFFAASLVAQDTTNPSNATVYFYRLREFYGAALKPSIYCDKVQVLRMRNGRYASITVTPGEHTITSNFPGSGVVLDAKAGETYYIQLEMSKPGMIHGGRGQVIEVEPGQGKFEVSQLKPAEPSDLKGDAAGEEDK